MDPVGTIELTPVKSGAPPGLEIPSNEPLKVNLSSEPKFAEGDKSHLARQNECLAMENARLAWENALLQQQYCWWQNGSDWYSVDQPWAIPQVGLHPGMTVVFEGLQRSVELNGQQAVVERWDDESGRWVVRLPCGEDKFARPENLVPACGWSSHLPGDLDVLGKKAGGVTTRKSSTLSFGSDTTATGTVRSSLSSFAGDDDVDSAPAADIPDEVKTTVMMRNIPNDYTREMLMKLVDHEGFAGCYRLFYLPIDYASRVSFGYAFVDLATPEEAARFRSHFQGFTAWDVVSQKVCEVCWSSVLQGVSAHIERYRNSPVMHESVPDEFRPILLVDGKRVPFPSATKSIRAPRARRSTKF